MYYILYRLDNLKEVHTDTKPLKPQNMRVYGIAEYYGEIPQNDWLTVANIREEIETWKEKETQYKTITELEPQEQWGVVYEEVTVEDEEGNPIQTTMPKRVKQIVDVEVEKVVEEEVEVEKSKTHIVCDLVAHFYPKVEPTAKQKAMSRIRMLKEELAKTDYQAIKYAEGWLTEEEYGPIKAQRQSYREEINQLEKMFNY